MSTKEAFEFAWIAQFSSDADGTPPPPIPSLSCWDAVGNLRSQDALRDELDSCRSRIADLRQNLRTEEFIEFYCQQELERRGGGSGGPRAVARRTASAPLRLSAHSATSKSALTSVPVETLYAEPLDSRIPEALYVKPVDSRITESLYTEPVDSRRIPRSPTDPNCAARSPSPEGLYSVPVDAYAVPVNAKHLDQVLSVSEPLYATPANPQPAKRPPHHVYEEVDINVQRVETENVDVTGHNSSDDESVANLMAIRQSVTRLSQFCLDGEAARRKLEMQAKRLSSRFSYATPAAGTMLKNNILDSVPESLLSPTTPSGMDLGNFLVFVTQLLFYKVHNKPGV